MLAPNAPVRLGALTRGFRRAGSPSPSKPRAERAAESEAHGGSRSKRGPQGASAPWPCPRRGSHLRGTLPLPWPPARARSLHNSPGALLPANCSGRGSEGPSGSGIRACNAPWGRLVLAPSASALEGACVGGAFWLASGVGACVDPELELRDERGQLLRLARELLGRARRLLGARRGLLRDMIHLPHRLVHLLDPERLLLAGARDLRCLARLPATLTGNRSTWGSTGSTSMRRSATPRRRQTGGAGGDAEAEVRPADGVSRRARGTGGERAHPGAPRARLTRGLTCAARRRRRVDRVCPNVPVRPWVLSLPWELRGLAAMRPGVIGAMDRIFAQEIARLTKRLAGKGGAETGSIGCPQLLGGSLDIHPPRPATMLDASVPCSTAPGRRSRSIASRCCVTAGWRTR